MTLKDYVNEIAENIRNNKTKVRVPVFKGVIKGKDGKSADEIAFEKIQVPIIQKYMKEVLGSEFTQDIFTAMSEEDFISLVEAMTENLGLMKGSDEQDEQNIETIINLIANTYGLK